MMILALEFSSPQRSVAIVRGETVLAQATETGGRSTAAFAMIERVLAEAKMEREQIETIAVGLGPGSYTGIRAAISIAQGWQLARKINASGVSSVEAIAMQVKAENIFGRVNVVIDAQRNEIYSAIYEISADTISEIEPLRIVSLPEIRERMNGIFAGPEIQKWFPNGRTIFPAAATLAELALTRKNFLPAERLEPIYLRETGFVKAPASHCI